MTLSQLEQEICDGGLKLTNASCLNDGLKLAWIKRTCLKSGDWQSILETLTDTKKNQISELDISSLEFMAKEIDNPFWAEFLRVWKV